MVATVPDRKQIQTAGPAPETSGELMTLVRLEIGEMRCVTPLDSVAAVVEPVSLVRDGDGERGVWIGHIPNARGSIPVASAFKLLGTGADDSLRRIVIFRGEHPIGLAVGNVLSSRVIEEGEILPFGDAAAVLHNLLVSGIVWNEEEPELVLDLGAILARLDRGITGARTMTEVLRSRQQRLVERYSNVDQRHGLEVRFRGSEERWMIPITTIRHVTDRPSGYPLPQAPRQVAGLVSWRRRPIPIIDPTIHLGIEQPVSEQGRLIVVGEPVAIGGASDAADAGLLVDEVVGLHTDLRAEGDQLMDAAGDPIRPINLLDTLSP